jgi:hypothetical protein
VKTTITHVAMDTHRKQHQVAWVHPETAEVQEFTVPNTVRALALFGAKPKAAPVVTPNVTQNMHLGLVLTGGACGQGPRGGGERKRGQAKCSSTTSLSWRVWERWTCWPS